MTLDEQIEWLQQKANNNYELAQDRLNEHDTLGYAKYTNMGDRYQFVVESIVGILEDCEELVKSVSELVRSEE